MAALATVAVEAEAAGAAREREAGVVTRACAKRGAPSACPAGTPPRCARRAPRCAARSTGGGRTACQWLAPWASRAWTQRLRPAWAPRPAPCCRSSAPWRRRATAPAALTPQHSRPETRASGFNVAARAESTHRGTKKDKQNKPSALAKPGSNIRRRHLQHALWPQSRQIERSSCRARVASRGSRGRFARRAGGERAAPRGLVRWNQSISIQNGSTFNLPTMRSLTTRPPICRDNIHT